MKRARVSIVENVDGDWRQLAVYRISAVRVTVREDGITLDGQVKPCSGIDETCLRCKQPGAFEQYNVLNAVWALSGFGPKDGCMHFKCLEEAIGRKLTVEDLSDAQWNNVLKHVMR